MRSRSESGRQQLEEMLHGDELVTVGSQELGSKAGRSRYSTWKKMRRQQCGLERVDDLGAARHSEADDTT